MFEIAAVCCGSFTLALSGALMPGPLFTVTIAESARRGASAGPLLMTGHVLLEVLLLLAVIVGLGPFLKSEPVIGVISVLGGTVLMWMGANMIRTAPGQSLNGSDSGSVSAASAHPIVLGIVASLSNPYWTLWWATIGLGYLLAAMEFGFQGVIAFFLGHIAADYGWYSVISFGISRGRALLEDRSYRIIIRACGVLLLGFGAWFLFSARGHLLRAWF